MRKALGDGGFANTGIAHQKRVVLATAAQHLNTALNLGIAPDQRVDVAGARLFVQIDTVFRERGFTSLDGVGFGVILGPFLVNVGGPAQRAGFAVSGILGNTMGDKVHCVIACHILLLQEISGVGFAFGKDRDKHVCPGHLGTARGLHMDRGALNHALEGGGRHGL